MSLITKKHEYFEAAFGYERRKQTQNSIALEMKVTPQYITKLIKKSENHELSDKAQNKIAKGCGFDLEQFIVRGQRIVNGEDPDSPESNANETVETGEEEVSKDKDKAIETLEGNIADLRSQVEELREDKKLLVADKKRLQAETEELKAKNEELEQKLEGANRALKNGQRKTQDSNDVIVHRDAQNY